MANADWDSQSEKIGEFLVKIGVMQAWQVDDILRAQESGDPSMFGELAIAFGYIDDRALRHYIDTRPRNTPSADSSRAALAARPVIR